MREAAKLMVEINSDRRREKRQPSQQKRAESRVKKQRKWQKVTHTCAHENRDTPDLRFSSRINLRRRINTETNKLLTGTIILHFDTLVITYK